MQAKRGAILNFRHGVTSLCFLFCNDSKHDKAIIYIWSWLNMYRHKCYILIEATDSFANHSQLPQGNGSKLIQYYQANTPCNFISELLKANF